MRAFQTEHDRIHDAIKDSIVCRELLPGQRLPQRRLAQQYETTTVTIREVFRSLEKSGLVVTAPKWGAIVVEVDPKTIREKYIVREALEVMAARLIAQGIDEIDKMDLLRSARECDNTLTSAEVSMLEKAKIHYAFHEKLVKTTHCDELINLISSINLYAILLSNTYHIDWTSDTPQAHEKLVMNITNNSPEIAEKYARRAVQRGYVREIQTLKRIDPEKFSDMHVVEELSPEA